jgi:hypothetical protein
MRTHQLLPRLRLVAEPLVPPRWHGTSKRSSSSHDWHELEIHLRHTGRCRLARTVCMVEGSRVGSDGPADGVVDLWGERHADRLRLPARVDGHLL